MDLQRSGCLKLAIVIMVIMVIIVLLLGPASYHEFTPFCLTFCLTFNILLNLHASNIHQNNFEWMELNVNVEQNKTASTFTMLQVSTTNQYFAVFEK